MIVTLIKLVLILLVAILAIGLLLWLIGLFLPAKRIYRTTNSIYLPVYMTLSKIEAQPFPKGFRGERQGDVFIQHLDRRGKLTVEWRKSGANNEVIWEATGRKHPGGSFRFTVKEKGIMSELSYERTLIIRRRMMRLFGQLISLRREAAELMKRLNYQEPKTANQ
jgi:hypothetical protein